MADKNLQELLDTVQSPVELLRNAQVGPNVYPGVPAEYTNWRDEQQAWQQSCVLFNQTYHMAELMVEGPDALALLTSLGVNSFATFEPGKAKQFVPCTPDGYVIGDVILFGLADDRYNLVGRAPVLNWVTYHAETAGHDVEVQFDQRTALRSDGRRRHYRFQVQGPNAMAVLEKALGHAPEDLKFFNMRTEQIAGVRGHRAAPRHGRPAGVGALRAVRGRRGRARGARERRPGSRAHARGRARLRVQRDRVGLDPVAASGRLHGRGPHGLSRVAARGRLRGLGLAGRQLRLGGHRGLLPHPVGPRLRPPRQVRPRLRRPRGARADGGRRAPHQGDARAQRRGRHADHRDDVPATAIGRSSSSGPTRSTRCTSTTT